MLDYDGADRLFAGEVLIQPMQDRPSVFLPSNHRCRAQPAEIEIEVELE